MLHPGYEDPVLTRSKQGDRGGMAGPARGGRRESLAVPAAWPLDTDDDAPHVPQTASVRYRKAISGSLVIQGSVLDHWPPCKLIYLG